MKKIVRGAALGVFAGLFISIVYSYMTASGEYFPMSPKSTSGKFLYENVTETTILLIAIISWALFGVGFTLAKKVYERDDWSVVKMTFTHLAIVILFFLPLSVLSGWYPLTTGAIVSFLIIFLVVYFIIWLIIFAINSRRIKKINHKLNN